MKRLLLAAVAIALFAVPGLSNAQQKYKFALVPKAMNNPFFDLARDGCMQAMKELPNVECVYIGPAEHTESEQVQILQDLISKGIDGIAVSSSNAAAVAVALKAAKDANIPVVTWDSDAPKSKRVAFYGVDDLAAGRIMGEQAVTLLGGKGKVAIITSVGATNLERRLAGVHEVLAKHKGMEIVEVYDIKEDPVRCAEIIASGTNRYPDLGAWISVGGWPVFTRNALAAVPPTTKVISFDTIPPAPDLLKAGKVQVLLGQKYFGWGGESVRILSDIKSGRPPASPIVDSGVDVVTAANVDDYVKQWKAWEKGEK